MELVLGKSYYTTEYVEEEALNFLKEYQPDKYLNAIVVDKPDIQNKIKSIGVEVVIVDFDDIIISTKFAGKTLLEYYKMTKKNYVTKEKLKLLLVDNMSKEVLDGFFQRRPLYFDKNGKVLLVNDINNLKTLRNNQKIYIPSRGDLEKLDHNHKIKFTVPPAQWTSNLPQMLLKKVKVKEAKIENYGFFNEMNLYIKCLSGNEDEYLYFKDIILKYDAEKGCRFKNIYITNYWSENRIFHINLEE